jgi:nucleoside-diphosphate-sugar epimerase
MHKILIIGCGDIALRIAGLLHPRYRLYGLVRNPAYLAKLRTAGITPIIGDLDQLHSLRNIAGLADTILHLAPPPAVERTAKVPAALHDTRTRHLLAALSHGRLPQRLVYISTSGVYGDCSGKLVDETRAKLRVDAELQIRRWASRNLVRTSILRVPGIYAADRLPLARLQKGTPAILTTEDGYTNHIHADDLAQCVVAAMLRGTANRIYHTVDDGQLKMGDYFDAVADAFGLPHPPRISRAAAQTELSPMLLSFMNESRRLSNIRMKQELQIRLVYPTVADALSRLGKINSSAAQQEMFPADSPPTR